MRNREAVAILYPDKEISKHNKINGTVKFTQKNKKIIYKI